MLCCRWCSHPRVAQPHSERFALVVVLRDHERAGGLVAPEEKRAKALERESKSRTRSDAGMVRMYMELASQWREPKRLSATNPWGTPARELVGWVFCIAGPRELFCSDSPRVRAYALITGGAHLGGALHDKSWAVSRVCGRGDALGSPIPDSGS